MGNAAIFAPRRERPHLLMLTERQHEILCFAWDYFHANDELPTMARIAEYMSFASANAAQEHVSALERKGFLERNECGRYKFAAKTRLGIVSCPVSGTGYLPYVMARAAAMSAHAPSPNAVPAPASPTATPRQP